jgi:hypothetical protein
MRESRVTRQTSSGGEGALRMNSVLLRDPKIRPEALSDLWVQDRYPFARDRLRENDTFAGNLDQPSMRGWTRLLSSFQALRARPF